MIDADDDIDTRETADKRRHRPWAVFDRSLSLCPNHGSYSIIPIAFFLFYRLRICRPTNLILHERHFRISKAQEILESF